MTQRHGKELQNAEILGREIPILLKWNGQIMRGTIDILYKKDDRVVIADYKTNHIENVRTACRIAEKYRHQKMCMLRPSNAALT